MSTFLGECHTAPYQQRISVGLPATLAGLREAEKKARLLAAQIVAREFDWDDWSKPKAAPKQLCGDWLAAFEKHYLAEGGNPDTWKGDYHKPLKKLPSQASLTVEVLTALCLNTKANTKTRKRTVMAANALSEFADLQWDGKHLQGNYSSAKAACRDLPTDLGIAQHREKLTNPAWQWVYGAMACYGLRNHEVFFLDLAEFPIIRVHNSTKTGFREVWPCYPEWAEHWKLKDRQLPNVRLDRPNQLIGHSVTEYLSPKLPFRPYDLRHAWAIRTLLFGWPVELSARQMGHSVDVHVKTYQRWINREQIQKVYELLVGRSDRPRPPEL